jgi:hypothetical protein
VAGDVGSSMGIGGSGGSFSRKTELVADLNSAFKTLNNTLKETERLTAQISKNIKGSMPGGKGGGPDLGLGLGSSSGTKTVTEVSTMSSNNGGNLLSNLGSSLFSLIKTAAGAGMQAMPTVSNALEANTLQSRFAFQGGAGGAGGFNKSAMALATGGTSTDQTGMDSMRASMSGNGAGLGPGSVGYGGFIQGIQAMSNVNPFISQQSAGESIVSLNSAKNVNMARMIGINIRDSKTGGMRSAAEIVNDIWSYLNQNKTGSGAISQADLDLSLQPGGALDSILNNYFSGTPELRIELIGLLRQKATGRGFSKVDALKTGASTKAIQSQGSLAASATNATLSSQQYEMKGFEQANSALTGINNEFAKLATNSVAFQKLLQAKGFTDTFAAGGNGGGAALMGGLSSFAGNLVGSIAGPLVKSLMGRGGSLAETIVEKTGLRALFPKLALDLFGKLSIGAILAQLLQGPITKMLEGLGHMLGINKGSTVSKAGHAAATAGFDALKGAGIGATIGSVVPGVGTAIGAGVGASIGAVYGLFSGWGSGGSDGTVSDPHFSKPLTGNPQITSPYGEVRYLKTPQGRNASYGKPHKGVDFGANEGTPVYAVKDGKVIPTGYDATGYGNYAKIAGADGFDTIYGHLSSISANGDIKAGQVIGYSGNSGNSTGPHLHFQVEKDGNPTDPLAYLSGAGNANGQANPLNPATVLSPKSTFLSLSAAGGEGNVPASDMRFSTKHETHGAVNYGGVTININVPYGTTVDAKAIAAQVKQSLEEDSIRAKAVTF